MADHPNSSPGENIPAWFHRYAIENERQHAALDQRITEMETRLVRWVVGSVGVGTAVIIAISRLFPG